MCCTKYLSIFVIEKVRKTILATLSEICILFAFKNHCVLVHWLKEYSWYYDHVGTVHILLNHVSWGGGSRPEVEKVVDSASLTHRKYFQN